jgi:hypothetical protein
MACIAGKSIKEIAMKYALISCLVVMGMTHATQPAAGGAVDFGTAKLRPVNRQFERTAERGGVHVSTGQGPGVVWIDGTDFGEGTIDLDVRGKDVPQASFVGVAFHRQDDQTYEAVYLRPFNFRAADPVRHHHAVQYVMVPEFDWPLLREKFPEEFERPVVASAEPTGWVPLRVSVRAGRIEVFAGGVTSPTMEVRKLGRLDRGQIGLWVGNNSDGDFANLRVTPAK